MTTKSSRTPYHSSWRRLQHTWPETIGLSRRRMLFMDKTEMKLSNKDATLKSLETQVRQISQILNTRPVGGFLNDT
ncbi:hypothetical protein GQ457_09G016410 [Hibiscus cannabinus]